MSNFAIFQTGLRSLRAHQQALDTTAHNIANANTLGYARQRAEMRTHRPMAMPAMNNNGQAGQMGTGIHITEITQIRDYFLDQQVRHELSRKGTWDGEAEKLTRIETFLNEPSGEGLAATFSQFFKELEALSQYPESTATRQSVIENGRMLADTFNQVYNQLGTYREDLNDSVEARVLEINTLGERLADLNAQIVRAKGYGDNPNDLMDQRQLITEELAELVNIRVKEDNYGSWNISIGGFHLVKGDSVHEIEAYEGEENDGLFSLRWEHNGHPVTLQSGKVEALIRGRDEYTGNFQERLNNIADTLREEFNALHREGHGLDGSTGNDFFLGEGAGVISVNPHIVENRSAFAAAIIEEDGDVDPDLVPEGNADNIFRMLELCDERIMENGTATMEDFYRSFTTEIGVLGQKADRMGHNQENLVSNIKKKREEVSGVSLDEEMANMIRFQHGYNAASRLISRMDEMMDSLIAMVR